MKRDIHKFSKWLEKTVRAGLADEKALRELKVTQSSLFKSSEATKPH